MDPLLTAFVEAVNAAYTNGGWFAVLSPVLLFAVRIYRLDQIESRLPLTWRWSSWPLWGKLTALFLTAGGSALVLALLANVSIGAALVAAIPVGLGAMLGHRGTKAIGKKVFKGQPTGYRGIVVDIATGTGRIVDGKRSGPR